MPKFSSKSIARLSTADEKLQALFKEVVKKYDCTILCGFRTKEKQDEYYYGKPQRSKVKYPNSKHNKMPSNAVDVVPYPIIWDATDRFYHFGGYVRGVAERMGIKIRWGGDWNGNFDLKDQNFFDLPHFELIDN